MKKISVVFGTRPEAIKLAPVIIELKKRTDILCHVCVTAQHRQMLDQILEAFNIHPDADLNLMLPDQDLGGLTARAITVLDKYFAAEKPDIALVQGDTTTTFCASLAAFYNKIPVGHVEAGLRTGDLYSPWPEEMNRALTTRLASWHFAPTQSNRQNLLHEGVPDESICVTGNTVIDALFLAVEKVKKKAPLIPGLPHDGLDWLGNARMILITAHRRESFGKGFEDICRAISDLAQAFPEVHFIYPVHLNPHVRESVNCNLSAKAGSNIHLIEPLGYLSFVALMNRAYLILTDSGGIQEEAPSLGKPVLVMRDITERPESVSAGAIKLIGTDHRVIVRSVTELLSNIALYDDMSHARNPYGDGTAARKILNRLLS
jgi:UDP-N-acetylglucosamine 2-epimerase (non-hydrolysing)